MTGNYFGRIIKDETLAPHFAWQGHMLSGAGLLHSTLNADAYFNAHEWPITFWVEARNLTDLVF